MKFVAPFKRGWSEQPPPTATAIATAMDVWSFQSPEPTQTHPARRPHRDAVGEPRPELSADAEGVAAGHHDRSEGAVAAGHAGAPNIRCLS